MYKLFTIIGLMLSMSLFAKSGNAPDYEKIYDDIADEQSQFFYPNLLDRFISNKTDFNLEEARHLYFGYIYTPEYSPSSPSEESVQLTEMVDDQKITSENARLIIELAKNCIKLNPIDFYALSVLALAYKTIGAVSDYDSIHKKINIIFEAISSTGSGKSVNKAYHIIYQSHERPFMEMQKLQFQYPQRLGKCEYFQVANKNNKFTKRVYFNIEKVLAEEEIYSDEEEQDM